MKQHIIVKASFEPIEGNYPFWGDVALGLKQPGISLYPPIDNLMNQYHLPFVVTQEYPKRSDNWTKEELKTGLNQYYRLILRANKSIPAELLDQIRLIPEVKHVNKSNFVSSELPRTSIGQSIPKQRLDDPRKFIGLDKVSPYSKGHPSIKIAVLDTGIDLNHPELQHCLLPGFDFVDIISGANQFVGDYLGYDQDPDDEVGHGTHVAGIIGAKGIAMSPGVVPNCKIIPVRVLGAMKKGSSKVGAGLVGNINAGIKWAVDNGADVINMSLGIIHEGGGLPHEEVVSYAQEKGVTIIAATGNDGQNALYFPSALPHVIAVGALDEEFRGAAHFSTYGDQVDFVAPGTDIYSTYLEGKYAFSTGTSHSAPFVSGAAALLKSYALQHGRKIEDKHIKYILKHSSDKTGKHFKDFKTGYGILNLPDALKLLNYKLNIQKPKLWENH